MSDRISPDHMKELIIGDNHIITTTEITKANIQFNIKSSKPFQKVYQAVLKYV